MTTRPDTRLPQSRAGGQEPYLRSLEHSGRSSETKDRKNTKKIKCDGWTDQRMDRRMDVADRQSIARDQKLIALSN